MSIRGAKLVKEDGYDVMGINANVKVGDVAYLVWAQYSTGDSFGRDGGQYTLLDVALTREEAEVAKKFYDEATHDGSYGAKAPYLPWFGYFESLDFVRVDGLVVT